MKSGRDPKEAYVDEQYDRRLGVCFRPADEISVISDLANELCVGDENEARDLLLQVQFDMFGRTWCDSLHIGDSDRQLVDMATVCDYMRLVAGRSDPDFFDKMAVRAANLAMIRLHESKLYRTMTFEIGGSSNVLTFERALALQGVWLPPQDRDDIAVYRAVVGRSLWELDLGMLRNYFVSCVLAWRTGMGGFEELDDDSKPAISATLTDVRIQLRRVARVVVARKALPKARPRFLSVGVEERSEQICLETALSFLN